MSKSVSFPSAALSATVSATPPATMRMSEARASVPSIPPLRIALATTSNCDSTQRPANATRALACSPMIGASTPRLARPEMRLAAFAAAARACGLDQSFPSAFSLCSVA